MADRRQLVPIPPSAEPIERQSLALIGFYGLWSHAKIERKIAFGQQTGFRLRVSIIDNNSPIHGRTLPNWVLMPP